MEKPRCRLAVSSNIHDALVFVDGNPVGTTPCVLDSLSPGRHHLRTLHPDLHNWVTESFDDTVDLAKGGEKAISYTFHTRYTVTSQPFGAMVYSSDSLIGSTPLMLQDHHGLPSLRLEKPGFESAVLSRPEAPGGMMTVSLTRKQGLAEDSPVFRNITPYERTSWPLYLTGTASVLSGVTAAYLKVKADNTYADYRSTGDPALLAKTNRLDRGAAIALIVTEVGLGLFTYFILSE